jgi:hypothetical protein
LLFVNKRDFILFPNKISSQSCRVKTFHLRVTVSYFKKKFTMIWIIVVFFVLSCEGKTTTFDFSQDSYASDFTISANGTDTGFTWTYQYGNTHIYNFNKKKELLGLLPLQCSSVLSHLLKSPYIYPSIFNKITECVRHFLIQYSLLLCRNGNVPRLLCNLQLSSPSQQSDNLDDHATLGFSKCHSSVQKRFFKRLQRHFSQF